MSNDKTQYYALYDPATHTGLTIGTASLLAKGFNVAECQEPSIAVIFKSKALGDELKAMRGRWDMEIRPVPIVLDAWRQIERMIEMEPILDDRHHLEDAQMPSQNGLGITGDLYTLQGYNLLEFQGIIDLGRGRYTEVSPSGTGIRIICRGKLPPGARRKGKVEMYDESSPRYLTITGHVLDGRGDIHDRQAEIEVVHAEHLGTEVTEDTKPTPAFDPPEDMDTDWVLEKAIMSRNGDRFSNLWHGKWEGYYRSQSEADLALAGDLAYWCGPDPDRIDTLFRQSGLYRDKWERADYREDTIGKAMCREEFYDWGCLEYDRINEIVTGGETYLAMSSLILSNKPSKPSGNGQMMEEFAHEIGEEMEQKAKAKPSFTRLVTSAELLAMDLRPEFLVKGVLVKGQPCIIGGRSKAMKTSIAVDLAISLGSGTRFLGKYDVPKPVKVAFWTGESGAPTIRETAVRVAKSKGIDLKDVSVSWSFDLPKLCRIEHLAALETVIREQQLQVIIIDPLYLSLLSAETAGSAGNIYAMGAARLSTNGGRTNPRSPTSSNGSRSRGSL